MTRKEIALDYLQKSLLDLNNCIDDYDNAQRVHDYYMGLCKKYGCNNEEILEVIRSVING